MIPLPNENLLEDCIHLIKAGETFLTIRLLLCRTILRFDCTVECCCTLLLCFHDYLHRLQSDAKLSLGALFNFLSVERLLRLYVLRSEAIPRF